MSDHLDDTSVATALRLRDLTDATQGPHALQHLVTAAADTLTGIWRRSPSPADAAPDASCRTITIRLPAIVTVADNYACLGYSDDAVTRDSRYTRYVDAERMLRSHTSAAIPAALRGLAAEPYPDNLYVVPGMCYRRDSIDRLHTGTPHQLDLWRIVRTPSIRAEDLRTMIEVLVDALLPGRSWRVIPSLHPYTVDGQQIDVHDGDQWVEIGECGLADRGLLARCGLDDRWGGLAMGLGLDRILMIRKGVSDIRLLRSADPRIAGQMLDLEPYRPVSMMPPIARDISVAVDARLDEEALGDVVRGALGADADVLESVSVLSCTPVDALPEVARRRLGIRPGQVNLLVRMVMRALDRTMTDRDANLLRDRIFRAVHAGDCPSSHVGLAHDECAGADS
jgi:phenylalanyl-tRNA synthetase alpha chain